MDRVVLRQHQLTAPGGSGWLGVELGVEGLVRPDVAVEMAPPRVLRVMTGGKPLLWAWVERDHGGVLWRRTDRWESLLPPIDVASSPVRRSLDDPTWLAHWAHRFVRSLRSRPGPLWNGRWLLRPVRLHAEGFRRPAPARWPGAYREAELAKDHPAGYIDWWLNGSSDILPLREMSEPDSARVKAFRRRGREGTLPPVLLWWIGGLDCWAILDGHDRYHVAMDHPEQVAFLGLTEVLEPDDARDRSRADPEVIYLERLDQMAPEQRTPAAIKSFGRALADDQFRLETSIRTRAFPLPGGEAAWTREVEALAPDWTAWINDRDQPA